MNVRITDGHECRATYLEVGLQDIYGGLGINRMGRSLYIYTCVKTRDRVCWVMSTLVSPEGRRFLKIDILYIKARSAI
jgi:hypothetical protein